MDKKMFENITIRSSDSFKSSISNRKVNNKPVKTFLRSSTSLMDKHDKSPKESIIGKKKKSDKNPFDLHKDFES